MEFFNSQSDRALDVCLNELRQSGAVVLIIGFRGGSLIPASDRLTLSDNNVEPQVYNPNR